jgi:NitT/TauT family transport system substrate-binding protein
MFVLAKVYSIRMTRADAITPVFTTPYVNGRCQRGEARTRWPQAHMARTFVKIAAAWLAMTLPASAADQIRLAVQKTGTFAWELEVIKEHGLDKKAGLDLEITQLATTEAEKIAIRGNSADLILSDWLWVSRERSLGTPLTFYPYSNALGAVIVAGKSPFKDLADLKGKKIAVAGGPLDKSWLLLQALAKRSNLDLKAQTEVLYGAPSLLSAKMTQGEVDANLNFWNFCVGLESSGYRRLIGMDTVEKELGAKAPVAMVGYVFNESFAAQHPKVIERFLAIAREAKTILAKSDEDWKRLGAQIGITSEAELALYRQRYLDGIPQRPVADEEADAKLLYHILAETGGTDLVGPAPELVPGTFFKPQMEN